MTNENGGRNDRLKVRNGCYVCCVFFSFFSGNCTIVLVKFFWECSYGNCNQTPPSTAENDDCSGSGNYYYSRSAVAGLRQSNSHLKPRIAAGEERDAKWRSKSVKRRGENKRQPEAFLDLGQSANGANPDGCAKEQPLKK
jgi:hypothetical protein